MKIKSAIIAALTILPTGAMAGPCASLFSRYNCLQWNSELETEDFRCGCERCPEGTHAFASSEEEPGYGNINGVIYTLHAGCRTECSCANNPNTSRRAGECMPQNTNMSQPDYSTCTATPTGAKLCNSVTNKCTGTSVTIAGQTYCKVTTATCNIPVAASSMLVSQYCTGGNGDPRGATCKVVECHPNATPDANRSSCNCNAGYYMNVSTFKCDACPAPGTSTPGSGKITSCFVPDYTNIKDTTGTYRFDSPCYYTE